MRKGFFEQWKENYIAALKTQYEKGFDNFIIWNKKALFESWVLFLIGLCIGVAVF